MTDPWKHRSEHMTCITCMWWAEKESAPGLPSSAIGRCRRHAPTIVGFPVTFTSDWCGDHKLDENKAAILSRDGGGKGTATAQVTGNVPVIVGPHRERRDNYPPPRS